MHAKKKILLVEDDGFTRFMMQEIRDTLGVEVDISASIQDGLTRYSSDPDAYGVVLMDVTLPDDVGLEASQRIRGLPGATGQSAPVIAVVGDERQVDAGVLSRYGIAGHLRKPLTPGEMMALVDQYC